MTGIPEKREPRRFEPPPWEREQFEDLARRKADEQEEAGKEESSAPSEEEASSLPAEEPGQELAEQQMRPPGAKEEIPPEAFDMMIAALREEEPGATAETWKVGLAAAVLMGTIGLALVIWGAVALARTVGAGPAGVMGSAIMVIMGGLLVALSVWMGQRSLQQRGVF